MKRNLEYTEVAAIEGHSLVSEWVSTGHSWHFHMLPPSCAYNPLSRSSHFLLLENTTELRNFAIISDRPERELGMQFAKLAHSDVFQTPKGQPTALWFQDWRARLIYNIETGIKWHHHLFLPSCVLNETECGWVLVLEDESDGTSAIQPCRRYPGPEFRFIERLVWKAKRP